MRNNPYFNFLKRDVMQVLLIFILIVVINVGISVVSNIYMALEPSFDRQINFFSQSEAMGSFMCFIMGVMFILKNFSAALSIRGDRVGFLKSFALWSVIISLFVALFGTIFEVSMKMLMEVITHKEVILISNAQWIEISDMEFKAIDVTFLWTLKIIFNRFITNLTLLSLGYMIGAVGYRLKKIYNIILFVIIPIVLVGFITNSAIRGDKFIMELGVKIIDMVVYICQNPMIITLIQLACIGVFSCIGSRFLIKAPTNEYAHDLI